LTIAAALAASGQTTAPLRVVIAGLAHGHAEGFLRQTKGRAVEIVGVWDPDPELHRKYAARHNLAPEIFSTNLEQTLERGKPEAVAAFGPTFDHPLVVEAGAKRRIAVMMEKPLAVSMQHARRIERAARQSGAPVIVNYETTWYRSHGAIWKLVKEAKTGGEIRKMVAMDGHQGPKEINVPPEFFGWLTDPVRNGAGALFDFGCYGANLMTWLMDDRRPRAVTAVTQQIKPGVYPKVDDEATVIVEYDRAVGIIEGSWNWPYSRKDLEVYTESASAVAVGGNVLKVRTRAGKEETLTPAELPGDERDSIAYLTAVARGRMKPGGLSSLENNLIVTEILEAARESARTGRRVILR
jgi:predicted dehydrogenase